MMGNMKWLSRIALGVLSAMLLISNTRADVFGVKTVYVLPMAGGLDQYLALELTSAGVLQVVTDPKKADTVFTDGIGARLEDSLTELYGAPIDKDQTGKDKADSPPPSMRPLSRSRGIVFLVNRTSRDVVWSTFAQAKNTQPDELRHTAAKIVSRLAKAHPAK